jgi:hypothetical protein
VTPLAAVLDVALAAAAAVLAAAWLVRRGVRAWRGKGGACGCPAETPAGCSAAAGIAKDLRAAAARGAARAKGSAAPPDGA